MKGKQFYEHCKEMLAKGFFVLAQIDSNTYILFTCHYDESGCIYSSGKLDTKEEAISPREICNGVPYFEVEFVDFDDIKVIDYYRPNDIFPSKPLKRGDNVRLSLANDLCNGMHGYVESIINDGLLYGVRMENGLLLEHLVEKNLYPLLPEEEKDDATEEAIKMLKKQGFKIIKE